ncbi:hypothetical protein DDE82_002900 [Stemphylium lycopersici]|nr:hypothetical protein DDE82_002900 [Stemphylium lycopersici]
MTLTHVLLGASSNLEIFAVTPENGHLLKHVRHIIVKVSPAIRWEVGLPNPFIFNLEEITQQRLCHRFRVSSPSEMSSSQQQYSDSYHEAMVQPFTENRRWYQLLRSANSSFGRIFAHFKNLTSISISHCERVDHPRPTATSTFVLQHGKQVIEDVHPVFVEDATVNMGWASAVILHAAPPGVKDLRLSLSNMDNFSSVAAVNRLLSLSYRHSALTASTSYLSNITRLSLSLRGVAGTHGDREWAGDTGSAGSVRFWTREINSMRQLRYLEFTNHLSEAKDIKFSDLQHSEPKASVLAWLLPRLELQELQTLALTGFVLLEKDLRDCTKGRWPRLQRLVLDGVTLTRKTSESDDVFGEHADGAIWRAFCREMAAK